MTQAAKKTCNGKNLAFIGKFRCTASLFGTRLDVGCDYAPNFTTEEYQNNLECSVSNSVYESNENHTCPGLTNRDTTEDKLSTLKTIATSLGLNGTTS